MLAKNAKTIFVKSPRLLVAHETGFVFLDPDTGKMLHQQQPGSYQLTAKKCWQNILTIFQVLTLAKKLTNHYVVVSAWEPNEAPRTSNPEIKALSASRYTKDVVCCAAPLPDLESFVAAVGSNVVKYQVKEKAYAGGSLGAGFFCLEKNAR